MISDKRTDDGFFFHLHNLKNGADIDKAAP